jgi:tetratricopeptide (TPR) repeat protein
LHEKAGDVLVAQGKLEEALEAYGSNLAIRERLASADPSNTQQQRDLSIYHNKVGDVLMAQGKPDEALQTYNDSLAIMKRLVATDATNTGWQRDLSISYERLGNVLAAQGKLAEALRVFRDCLAVRDRLTSIDRNNTQWQRDRWVSDAKIAEVLVAQGELTEALRAYRDGLAIIERLTKTEPANTQWQNDLQFIIGQIGGMAYRFVLARDFTSALDAADEASKLAPEELGIEVNRAHALMLVGRADEAGTVYLRHRGTMNVNGDNSWEAVVLADFAEMRAAGLTHPLMDEIEALFGQSVAHAPQ